ncbi:SusD/RagB family nutrient-binding outer membrane lipoprotein [Belliella kenyensis]|uniref:SusD/RagB family nutrient-binding outer membrane lipoprotein n=1 Tax=Belliella kenyensis TaxID=1472724 RepID=A0ABV8EMB4_9BACT|nr:SusD/RagB family nutrient-binding outer membrane lipoprotein [Belliella kenyensis]MCH7403004.1 SusD/RagB family nutrient-binding outer membrane lipoprotein [Belliella kenyensis]MDN3605040.1 SusD/RagB family nutrient-binding outer membrane lipoprotein [Belliella kenyensis]
MKYISNYLIGLFLFSLGIISCTEGFEEMNSDPNNPTMVPAENLLTQAEFSLSNLMWSRALNFDFGMLMVQQFSQSEYAERSRYNFNPGNFDNIWNTFYAGGMNDLQAAMRITEANENLTTAQRNNRIAILELLRIWSFQNITDIWVNVPYSQTFNPAEFPNPRYDKQQDVYAGLLSEIDAALSKITVGTSSFTTGDIYYAGDMAKWQKFGNSLKVRIGMRIADVDEASARRLVSEGFAAGVISSYEEGFHFPFQSDQRIANPFFVDNTIGNRDDFTLSDVLVGIMSERNDPRIPSFGNPNVSGQFVGLPYGLTDGETFSLQGTASRPSTRLRSATAPAHLLTHAEMKFFEAEAIARGFISGNAAEAYNAGIAASMRQWGITDQQAINNYLALPINAYNADNWKNSIGIQKWIALYGNGIEAWSEWRRLDYPQLTVPAAAVRTSIPVRALYPAVELGNNPDAVANAGFQNEMNIKPWWDVN